MFSPFKPVPFIAALCGFAVSAGLSAQANPNLFRDDTLNNLSPTQSEKAAHFPMLTIEQPAFACGARFTNDTDLTSPRPIIFYDLCHAGNSVRVSKAVDHLVIDCTPEAGLQLLAAPPPDSREGTPEFRFASGGSQVQCALDGGAYAPCASPWRTPALADGPHRLALLTLNSAGALSSGLVFDWRIDRRAPPPPTLALANDASEASGFAEPGALVGVRLCNDSRCALAQARAGADGRWRAPLDPAARPPGALQLGALQFDPAGNVSPEEQVALPAPEPPAAAGFGASVGGPPPDAPAEAAACLSTDPAQWPASAKPYFLVLVDSSGSMILPVAGAAPSCGYPSTRMGHAKCAVRNMLNAYDGQAEFGIAQYATYMTGCGANCYGNTSGAPNPACNVNVYNAEVNTTGTAGGCGPMDNVANPATRRGATMLVGVRQDNFWITPPNAQNLAPMQSQLDNNCTNNLEVTNPPSDGPQYGKTPLNGALRDAARYFQAGWSNPDNGAISFLTPLSANDYAGAGVNGSTGCRSVNVILLTDGDETCDTQADAVNAAAALYSTGVTVGGKTYKIRVFVINFAGGSQANTDAIAAAGGTGASYFATNETQLAQAVSAIVAGAVKPEAGDNLDNNCNGCTDEGFTHYCDQGQTCCAWGTPAQRTTCLNNYKTSITPANPTGNRALLPCTTPAQQADPANWLTYNPGESCDNLDNNCSGGVDEGLLKCGNPLHCPIAETCNGLDDNCDGIIDNGCPGVVGPEVCNGCDDDFNGLADDNIAAAPCGLASPANCQGTRSCRPAQAVTPGGCVASNYGWNACANSPQPEVCGDGLDNDCNGAIDDGNPACPYGGRTELCNGVDDNCNGLIDEGVTPPPDGKVGICGVSPVASAPECTTAVTLACVGGAWQCAFPAGVCTAGGGCAATAETCDALDNNCDGRRNENVTGYGQVCHSDDANPVPGDGACRTTGTMQCSGPDAVSCSATKNNAAAGPELCDGIDNDCDGTTDEPFTAKGTNATYFVKPAVTKIAAGLWIYSHEASRPNANNALPGSGNGYQTSAPAGATLDKTRACSVSGRIPWFNVTPLEAEQTCTAMGGALCTPPQWQTACTTNPPSGTTCTWGYNTRTACTSTYVPLSKFCNLAPSYDFNGASSGDQDGLLTTGNPALANCWGDWSGLLGNTTTTNKCYDLTGNLREITKNTTNDYRLMGGAFLSQATDGATCGFTFYAVDQNFQYFDTGFRCCFSADPTL